MPTVSNVFVSGKRTVTESVGTKVSKFKRVRQVLLENPLREVTEEIIVVVYRKSVNSPVDQKPLEANSVEGNKGVEKVDETHRN